jgi:hypothetical protein
MHNDFSCNALFYPDRCPVFAGFESIAPFDPHTTGYSLANAWWLANLCQLAYCQDCDIARELERVGLCLQHSCCGQSTQGFLTTGPDFAILVFRGTEIEQWPDVLADAEFILTPMRGAPEVHAGFQKALNEIWPEVLAALDEVMAQSLPVWYTGYSLGAALATLAAARRPPAAMVTFGSPRVGEDDFVRLLQDLPIQRFVNCCDIVTQVPPLSFGYMHVGQMEFITSHGRVMRNPESWHVARRQLVGQIEYVAKLPWLRRGMVKLRSVADHAIVNYIAGIVSELQHSRN